jgi:NDP-sugar pyrophosphorylase family protein
MRPLTLTVPKSLLEVAGRPFIDWQLEALAGCGYREVVLCVAHLGDQIRAHVGDGARFGLRALYSDERFGGGAPKRRPKRRPDAEPQLLGTAGALRAALDLLAPTFLVTYGDSFLPFDYAAPLRMLDAHESDCDGVMAVYKNEGRWDASNVATDGTWVLRYEKGASDRALDHIDYGATALKKSTIASLSAGRAHGLDAIQRDLAQRKRLRASVARERFFEIGSPEGLATLARHLSSQAKASSR